MWTLEHLIRLGGVLHFGILISSVLVPRALDWKRELSKLPPLLRQLIWVHGVFIVLVIVAFGVISLLHARDLAAGSALARSFCGFVALFWLLRLLTQFFVFDAKPYLRGRFLTVGYHALTVVFACLVVIFGAAALSAGTR